LRDVKNVSKCLISSFEMRIRTNLTWKRTIGYNNKESHSWDFNHVDGVANTFLHRV